MNVFFKYLLSTVCLCIVTASALAKDQQKTLLAIFAHPDDEGIVAPMLAKYASEGVNVRWVIITDGQFGVREHAKIPAGQALIDVRQKEAICASEQLGISAPTFLDYVDADLHKRENLHKLNIDLIALINDIKPDTIVTWGPDGGYGHADHRLVSSVLTGIIQQGGENMPDELLYAGVPSFQREGLKNIKTQFGHYIKQVWGVTDLDYLSYRIPFSAHDLTKTRNAFSCYQSQFTEDELTDIFNFMSQANGVTYLRPALLKSVQHNSVFSTAND